MRSFKDHLQEVHYTDKYSKRFDEFRKKYRKAKGLYVQFTNHAGDVLERNPYGDPNHSDPVGVYGYPIEYVINNPSDIWYGSDAQFLRVLETTDHRKTLLVSSMQMWQTYDYLRQAFGWRVSEIDEKIGLLKKIRDDIKGVTAPGKIFFALIQLDFDNGERVEHQYHSRKWHIKPKVRPGKEQTALLSKLGIWALEDRSTNIKQAVVNDREPQQIIYLNRHAFKVKEVFRMSDAAGNVGVTNRPEKKERPLAAAIADAIDDKLIQGPERSNRAGWSAYWTKKGRRIDLYFNDESVQWKMKNLKLGQKPHKMHKLYDSHSVKVKIVSEYGNYSGYFTDEEKFADIAYSISKEWTRMVEEGNMVPDWNPLSKEYEEQKAKEAADDEYQRKFAERLKEGFSELMEAVPSIKQAALKNGINIGSDFWENLSIQNGRIALDIKSVVAFCNNYLRRIGITVGNEDDVRLEDMESHINMYFDPGTNDGVASDSFVGVEKYETVFRDLLKKMIVDWKYSGGQGTWLDRRFTLKEVFDYYLKALQEKEERENQ